MLSPAQAQALLHEAQAAAQKAYAPYSSFPVGAALLTQQGVVIAGANVENASYGLSLCAERVALVKAVSEGERNFAAMAVWAEKMPHGAVTPCGACRQMLVEFLPLEAPIVMMDPDSGAVFQETLGSLLPRQFSLSQYK